MSLLVPATFPFRNAQWYTQQSKCESRLLSLEVCCFYFRLEGVLVHPVFPAVPYGLRKMNTSFCWPCPVALGIHAERAVGSGWVRKNVHLYEVVLYPGQSLEVVSLWLSTNLVQQSKTNPLMYIYNFQNKVIRESFTVEPQCGEWPQEAR